MQLYSIPTGNFKLDGGAMFGVVPKSIWNRSNPADDNNMCSWAMRCMLVEEGDRLMLIDNGLGDKQSEKFFSYYFLHGDDSLEKSLKKLGYHHTDITDVFLTHLHFDHCGGSIKRKGENDFEPAFPNATYWSNKAHWEWAVHPNAREKASFLKENILPIQESGQLKFVEEGDVIFPGMSVLMVDGHTESMMIPHLEYKDRTVVFMADLLPSIGHIPLPYVMSYDVRPLITLEEKGKFLNEAVEKDYVLFFEHDPQHECCTLEMTDRGPRMKDVFDLNSL
ncbi:MAG: MBL fold metallo-hydrolase [Flavobacteriales bacterium]|nr:MBL fold metallo-hydrolase [Flavobacteriales bacterium]